MARIYFYTDSSHFICTSFNKINHYFKWDTIFLFTVFSNILIQIKYYILKNCFFFIYIFIYMGLISCKFN